jgi:hypothetical protein
MPGLWETVKSVVSYVESAVRSFIGVEKTTEILQEYAPEIGVTDFADAYSEISQAVEIWERIKDIPGSYEISGEFALPSAFDWREQYVMKAKVSGYLPGTLEYVEKWVTAESAIPLTRNEWDKALQDALWGTEGSPGFDIEEVSEYSYFEREW